MTPSNFELEEGPEKDSKTCNCCGKLSRSMHGFLYKDGDARAVYYAAWSEGHPERGVSMAIAIGEWSDDSTTSDRTSIGVRALAKDTDIQFTILDPGDSPWAITDLFGTMIQRKQALNHPLREELFQILENIVRVDSRVAPFLNS